MKYLMLLWLSLACVAQQCGPPNYACARGITDGVGDMRFYPDPRTGAPTFGGSYGANRTFVDSRFRNIQMFRCTDYDTILGDGFATGVGGSGEKTAWNKDGTLLEMIGNGGFVLLSRVDRAKNACTPVCANNGVSNPTCAGSAVKPFSLGVFSRRDPNTFFAYAWWENPSLRIVAVTVPAVGQPFSTKIVADFSPALYRGVTNDWRSDQLYTLGEVIQPRQNNGPNDQPLYQAVTTGSSGYSEPVWSNTTNADQAGTHTALPRPDYAGGTVVPSTLIFPHSNNTLRRLFISGAGGVTSTQPDWDADCPNSCADGSVTWRSIGGTATIRDGSVTWVQVGPTQSAIHQDVTGVEGGDDLFAMSLSYIGGQNSGNWALAYRASTQTLYQLNTYSGVETDYQCVGGSGYNCVGGSWASKIVGVLASPWRITIHSTTLSKDGKYLQLTAGDQCNSINFDAGCPPAQFQYFWKPGTGSWTVGTNYIDGHSAIGFTHFVNNGAGNSPIDGRYLSVRPLSNPAYPQALWPITGCTHTGVFPPFPCNGIWDHHLSWDYNLGRDQEPLVGATYVNGRFPRTQPFAYEIMSVSACGLAGEPACPNGYQKNHQTRLAGTYNFGTNNQAFESFASIGALSQDGKLYALTTTGFCTMGTTDGKAPRCGFDWSSSYEYANSQTIVPEYNNPGTYAFRASCSNCRSGPSYPQWWCQKAGCTVIDGGITWTNEGVTNGRSDVLIYKLDSQLKP